MKKEKLAFKAEASAYAYGEGGHVVASFLCATPDKARKLVEILNTAFADDAPEWAEAAPAKATTKNPL